MNMERNRFEYGHIIDQNTFEQTAEEIKREVCEKINFKNGILREINEVQFNNGIMDLCQYFGHKKLNFSPSITYAERIIS